VRVKRMYLVQDEQGKPNRYEYEEFNEPRQYDIDDEVFICAASWEDLPALLQRRRKPGKRSLVDVSGYA